MATVGQVLTTPESGWRRYDDIHPAFKYKNFPNLATVVAGAYNKTTSFNANGSNVGELRFMFTGPQVRIITPTGAPSYRAFSVDIYIDGVKESFSMNNVNQYMNLSYEKIGLSNGIHEVVINNFVAGDSNYAPFGLDAVDIADTGRLLHPDEVTDIKDLVVGKRIRCNYKAISNAVGNFSRWGEEFLDFIPPASSAAPDGDFYFIMVEDWNNKKILIADRNIQHSISWDTLNTYGIASGSGLVIYSPIVDTEMTMRLLSGGTSSTDKDNEWDKYIVGSDLGGTVIPGDNQVWNASAGNLRSRTSSTPSANNTYRASRGGTVGVDGYSAASDTLTSNTSSLQGFRPLLEIVSTAAPFVPPVLIPTHLYKIESGLLFTDDFNSFHPRWVMSATDKYSLSDRPSYLRLKNDDRLDTFILSEIPTELFAIEVMTDYNPTEVGQQGGILVWKDNANKIEFLESYDSTQPVQQNNWMAVKEGINWTFLSDEGQGYNFVDTALIDANRFGIILKKQSGANSADLDIDKVIATRGNKMAVLNVKIGQIIQLTDTLGNVIVEHVLIEGSSMMFSLPRLEIEGILNILEADRTLSNSISATFHGGDVYSIGTVMEVRIADAELSRISLTDLGAMNGGVLEVQMNVFNPTGVTVSDIELSISEYIDKFGWQWADVALDVSGVPGSYSDTIKIPSVDGGNQVNFWVKVARGISTGYNGIDDLQFNVHLKHA